MKLQVLPENTFNEQRKSSSPLDTKKSGHSIFDKMLEGIHIIDFNWRYIYLNDAVLNFVKVAREELLGYTIQEKYPGIETTALFPLLQQCMQEGKEAKFDYEYKFTDDSSGYFQLNIQPCTEGVLILSIDITGYVKTKKQSEAANTRLLQQIQETAAVEKKAAEKLLKANRLYAFLSGINQSIVHIQNQQELFDAACNIAISIGKFKIAWIGLADSNGIVRLQSLKGDTDLSYEFGRNAVMDLRSHVLFETILGKAYHTKKYAVSNAVLTDESMVVWKDVFARHNINSSIALPLISNNNVIGLLGFSSTVAYFFDDEEIRLLKEAAIDICFAIETINNTEKHRKAEQLVEENEKRFRTLIENSSDIKALSTFEGKTLYCSPAVTKILGYTQQECCEKSMAELVHPDHLQKLVAQRLMIKNIPGSSFYTQHLVKHKNGNWIWLEGTVSNHLHEPGIEAIVSNYTNITARKSAEEKEEFNRNNLNALINGTQDLIWSIGNDFKLITFNKRFEEMLQYLTGETIPDLCAYDVRDFKIPAARKERMNSFYARALSGEIFTATQYVDTPVELWTEISFNPIYKNDKIVGTACHARDVTQRTLIEKELRYNEAFNKDVLNSLHAQIAVLKNTGKIITVNNVWKEITAQNCGLPGGNAGIGDNYFDQCKAAAVKGDKVAAEILNGITNVLEKKQSLFYNEYEYSCDNEQRWLSLQAILFESDDSMLVLSRQDISVRKKAEIERFDIVNTLLQRNKDLEQFSYIVSHNLRAPVANILGSIDLLNTNELPKEEKEELTKGLDKSVKRLDTVIKDLNYILKVRSNTDEAKELVLLSSLVEDIIIGVEYLITGKNIKITYNFSAINELKTYKNYMRSILYNLISNSIKYRQAGIETIIHIESRLSNEGIELIAGDNGIGIDMNTNGKNLFGLYKRFHTEIDGKGMGLYLVKTQVELLGGKISVESEEMKGTQFKIVFKA